MAPRSRLLAIVFALSALVVSRAANIPIDDTEDGWTFEPVSFFGSVSAAAPCDQCTSQPDAKQAYHETWRDCVKRGTATLTFEGVGVTVYTICPGPHQGGVYVGHFTFTLDGEAKPEWKEDAAGCATYKYQYPIFNVTGLSKGKHTIAITNADEDTSNFLLDFAVVDDGNGSSSSGSGASGGSDEPPSKKGSLPVAAIVVPVLVLVLLLLAGVLFLIMKRRRRIQRRAELGAAEPKPYQSASISGNESSIPLAVYTPPPDAAAEALARVQAAGNDPELEAALHIISARSRQNAHETTQSVHAISSPTSPTTPPITGPTVGWTRDRKGGQKEQQTTASSPSHDTTPNSSTIGTNWSTTPTASDATPPAYDDATRRR